MFRNARCITFDLDDTLWPVAPVIEMAEQKLYDWLHKHHPKITAKYSHQALSQHRQHWCQTVPELAHDVTQLRWQHLVELAKEFNYGQELADQGLALFRQHRNQVTPFDTVEPVLSTLQKSYTIGAITNGNAQLENTPLAKYFKFSISAAQIGANKPSSSYSKLQPHRLMSSWSSSYMSVTLLKQTSSVPIELGVVRFGLIQHIEYGQVDKTHMRSFTV